MNGGGMPTDVEPKTFLVDDSMIETLRLSGKVKVEAANLTLRPHPELTRIQVEPDSARSTNHVGETYDGGYQKPDTDRVMALEHQLSLNMTELHHAHLLIEKLRATAETWMDTATMLLKLEADRIKARDAEPDPPKLHSGEVKEPEVDRLASIFYQHIRGPEHPDWSHLAGIEKEGFMAGVRSVLAAIEDPAYWPKRQSPKINRYVR